MQQVFSVVGSQLFSWQLKNCCKMHISFSFVIGVALAIFSVVTVCIAIFAFASLIKDSKRKTL